MVQVFLLYTTGTQVTWPDPGNWNPADNKVECVGSGANGQTGRVDAAGGFGGAGGGYAYATNMALTFPVPYFVIKVGGANQCTAFNSTNNTFSGAAGKVLAEAGSLGGLSGSGTGGRFYPSGFAGGNAGAGGGNGLNDGGGGGGGAGGPNGAGSNGSAGASGGTGSGGAGGAANGGTVVGALPGTVGNSGTQWDATHGCGSGGGGGNSGNSATAKSGGKYGGGGGGGGDGANHPGGAATEGLIIITYVPPAVGVGAMMMGV